MTRYRIQAEPIPHDERVPFEETPLGFVVALLILLSLFLGVPFLIWLVAA